MKIVAIFGVTSLITVLAACKPQAAEPGNSGAALETTDLCGASKLSSWVGKTDTPAARNAIAQASGAKTIRWITPGMAVTMDFRSDRLNANIDADGRFTGFSCT